MRVLVLGGIRSGKSELAEQLVAQAVAGTASPAGPAERVRYVATAKPGDDDPEWTARLAAHRARRPATWQTEEVGGTPERLADLLTDAKPDEVLLVDDLGGWLTATLDAANAWTHPSAADAAIDGLADAVRACPAARLVLVGAEVGLTVVPMTDGGRTFADANGALNQRIAAVCDAVALVVAGQPTWLRGGVGPAPVAPTPVPAPVAPAPAPTAPPPEPFVVDGARAGAASTETTPAVPALQPGQEHGLDLPMPDDTAADEADRRLLTLAFAGHGLGALAPVVRFAAGTQERADPRPWHTPRVLLLRGDHAGGASAGEPAEDADRLVGDAHAGTGPLAVLAAAAGATVRTVDCPPAAAMEDEDVLGTEAVQEALERGWHLADSAVDEGADALVLAACGTGRDTAAAAIVAVVTGGEPAALLGRLVHADGSVDDEAWMRRCGAVRDAIHRVRARSREPRNLLAMLGGGDLAVATGLLIGATARKTPVLLSGPVGVAAALLARDFGAQTRHWLVLPDHGNHPTVKLAADVIGLTPLVDLRLGLGEGATALATLPLLNTALTLAAATAQHGA
jgi:nicotinate-nucleotide--dimethylbenzimidazole phosphoribosyltransferase